MGSLKLNTIAMGDGGKGTQKVNGCIAFFDQSQFCWHVSAFNDLSRILKPGPTTLVGITGLQWPSTRRDERRLRTC
jgi:hypothetical protein